MDVEYYEHGMALYGTMPVSEADKWFNIGTAHGYDWVDALIGQHLGACMVFTTKEQSEKWRAELKLELKNGNVHDGEVSSPTD